MATERVLELVAVEAVVGKFRAVPRERVEIWEGKVKRRGPRELHELISEAIVKRTDREMTEMAFKGSKPDKGGDSKGGLVEQMQKTLDVQARVIEALARALEAAAATEVHPDEDDEEEDEGEDKES